MLSILLNLLPKLPAAIASLGEFAALISRAKYTMNENDQAKLQSAYELAMRDDDAARDELDELVRTHTQGG